MGEIMDTNKIIYWGVLIIAIILVPHLNGCALIFGIPGGVRTGWYVDLYCSLALVIVIVGLLVRPKVLRASGLAILLVSLSIGLYNIGALISYRTENIRNAKMQRTKSYNMP